MKRLIAAAAVFAFILGARVARADVGIREMRWLIQQPGPAGKPAYLQAETWSQPPAAVFPGKPRAAVTLINNGQKLAEGIVFRYAVSAKLAPIDKPDDAGVWTVPFWAEDHRIAWLKPGQSLEVPVDSLLLATYLKKIYRAGFWPKEMRIEAMVEVRPGEAMQPPIQKTLSVVWTDGKKP